MVTSEESVKVPQPKDASVRLTKVSIMRRLLQLKHNMRTARVCVCVWACTLCVDFFCMSLKRDTVHFLPPFPAKWPRCDLQLIMRPFSVGRCCCLLILSFTYNRQVLFTNRKQSSRCFIMSLLCVLTNAAGCLPRLAPLCRLLPGLERTARPATGGTRL